MEQVADFVTNCEGHVGAGSQIMGSMTALKIVTGPTSEIEMKDKHPSSGEYTFTLSTTDTFQLSKST
jgi:hypothetical protein